MRRIAHTKANERGSREQWTMRAGIGAQTALSAVVCISLMAHTVPVSQRTLRSQRSIPCGLGDCVGEGSVTGGSSPANLCVPRWANGPFESCAWEHLVALRRGRRGLMQLRGGGRPQTRSRRAQDQDDSESGLILSRSRSSSRDSSGAPPRLPVGGSESSDYGTSSDSSESAADERSLRRSVGKVGQAREGFDESAEIRLGKSDSSDGSASDADVHVREWAAKTAAAAPGVEAAGSKDVEDAGVDAGGVFDRRWLGADMALTARALSALRMALPCRAAI